MVPPIVAFKDLHRGRLADAHVIDLSQAVPSYAPPPPATTALAGAASDPLAARYTPDPGLPDCREAIAEYLTRRHGARVNATQVLVTPGANAAFHFAANVLLDPGERATLLAPYYFNHLMSIQLLGNEGHEIRIPLAPHLSQVLKSGALDGIPEGEVLVVVNPSNPTGRRFDGEELRALWDWASARGVRLVVDETYLEFHPTEPPATSVLSFAGWPETAIVVGTFSKSLAMTGYRIGYLVAAAPLVEEVLKVQDAAVVCASRPGQLAVTATLAWDDLDGWLEMNRQEIAARVSTFVEALGTTPGPFEIECAGAFFAYVRHAAELNQRAADSPPGIPARWRVADRLAREADVVCLPGAVFGEDEGNRLRVAVGNAAADRLREAARRMQGII
jgi:aspartate/methionine/tyrosine aminotransferase